MSNRKVNRRRLRQGLIGVGVMLGLCAPHASYAAKPYVQGFEFAFTAGQNSGAFDTRSDFNIGGTLNLPIFAADPLFGQELIGEILLGHAKTKDTGQFRAPTVLMVLPTELAPHDEMELTTFQVGAGLKYKLLALPEMGFLHIQPYLSAGAAFHVFLASTSGTGEDRVGGIAPISPDLAARGFPTGEGNVLVGAMYGVGTDFVFFDNILLGVDARWNNISRRGADYSTVVAKVGFRF